MAELGSYQIPKEYKDEDKWLRFFTLPQLGYMAIALGLSGVTCLFTFLLHIIFVGIVLSVIYFLFFGLVAFLVIPKDRYMFGGGYTFRELLLRVIIKNLPRNRKLYVKNYEEG